MSEALSLQTAFEAQERCLLQILPRRHIAGSTEGNLMKTVMLQKAPLGWSWTANDNVFSGCHASVSSLSD